MVSNKEGLYALEKVDLFNLLCIPPYKADENIDKDLILKAAEYCEKRRAMLILDAPSSWLNKEAVVDGMKKSIGTLSRNAAIFFPRIIQRNPLKDNQKEIFASCGAIAGIFARIDASRGIWKAPAGIEATMKNVEGLSVQLTDDENEVLNPLGVNCLRSFPIYGNVIWGSRTLRGADHLADEYKYIPVRRLALFIEESLYRGTKWIVYKPNNEQLWAQIRMNVGSFMNNLYNKGAFQGTKPAEAYYVKCDCETTTNDDIKNGIVNFFVGFAPLKPGEFVIIKIRQRAEKSDF